MADLPFLRIGSLRGVHEFMDGLRKRGRDIPVDPDLVTGGEPPLLQPAAVGDIRIAHRLCAHPTDGRHVGREPGPFLARRRSIAPRKGYTNLTTESAKIALYAPGQFGLTTHYGNLDRIMKAAINGVWS